MNDRRILIVDDENSLRKVLGDLLRLRGYDPVAVGSGEEALDVLREGPCAVAIIDLALDKGGGIMDGVELLHRVREQYPTTECVVLTGAPSQQSAIEAVSVGVFSYLLKPFNITELVGTLERAIERRGEQVASAGVTPSPGNESQSLRRFSSTLRSECLARLTDIVALAQNVMAADNVDDARRFGKLLEKDAQQVVTTINTLLDGGDVCRSES